MDLQSIQAQLGPVGDMLRAGFNQINAVEGLFIAAIAALLMPSLPRLLHAAVLATLANIIVDALMPMLMQHQPIQLPPLLDPNFWWPYVAALFVGYLFVIAIFYFVKRVILRAVQ